MGEKSQYFPVRCYNLCWEVNNIQTAQQSQISKITKFAASFSRKSA